MDKLAGQIKGIKYLLIAVDVFLRLVKVQTRKTKYAKGTMQVFKKKLLGLIRQQNLGKISVNFARRKTLNVTQQ